MVQPGGHVEKVDRTILDTAKREIFEETGLTDLEQQFLITELERKTLEKKLSANEIELNACYDVIKELLVKNESMQKILSDKLGIDLNNEKNKL